MPGFLLHLGSAVSCVHGGVALPTAPNPRVRLSGQPVVTQPPPYSVAGCANPALSGGPPCATAQWLSSATRLKASGQALVLSDSQAIAMPTETPLTIQSTQTRVRGQ